MQIIVQDIPIEVRRKRIKNMYLRVYPREGRVLISAPLFTSDAAIEGFVSSKLPWIRAKLASTASTEQKAGQEAAEATFYLWGTPYPLTRVEGSTYSLVINDGHATFSAPATSAPEQREAYLLEWYREKLCHEVSRLLPLWEERTGLRCAEWRTKNMKTRWGSCNTKARRIWLNVQLAKYPRSCLEYVIVHELTHLIEPSHGPRFKAEMDKFLPNWRTTRKELNAFALD